eukprot:11207153-Lingulodinium_polyedra.AAC.1
MGRKDGALGDGSLSGGKASHAPAAAARVRAPRRRLGSDLHERALLVEGPPERRRVVGQRWEDLPR